MCFVLEKKRGRRKKEEEVKEGRGGGSIYSLPDNNFFHVYMQKLHFQKSFIYLARKKEEEEKEGEEKGK